MPNDSKAKEVTQNDDVVMEPVKHAPLHAPDREPDRGPQVSQYRGLRQSQIEQISDPNERVLHREAFVEANTSRTKQQEAQEVLATYGIIVPLGDAEAVLAKYSGS